MNLRSGAVVVLLAAATCFLCAFPTISAAQVVALASITVDPNPAHPGDHISISGEDQDAGGIETCGVEIGPGNGAPFANDEIDASCSVDPNGAISGSFTVPADLEPTTVTVKVCVGACQKGDGSSEWSASASLEVEAVVVPDVSISVSPNPAKPGDKITISGKGPESADTRTCFVDIDDVPPTAQCSIDSKGVIGGSFTLPVDNTPGTLTVSVCEVDCQQVSGLQRRASTTLTVRSETPPKDVVIPNLAGLSRNQAEVAVRHAALRIKVSGDSSGVVSDQVPAAGERVARNSVVAVTFVVRLVPRPPDPTRTAIVVSAVAIAVLLAIVAAAAMTSVRLRHRKQLRWVDEHVSVGAYPSPPIQRAEPTAFHDSDHEIAVVATPHDERISVLEAPR